MDRLAVTIIVTGAAGFIGHAVAHRLLARGETVVGVDSFNDYYDPALKAARAATFEGLAGFRMVRMDIAEAAAVAALLRETGAVRVVHLAAQAGVRYSLENPFAYERSNLAGHLSVMEACRHQPGFEHLVYASSSSVYGDKPLGGQGFTEDEPAAQPVSLYAATKRSDELLSATYSHLYGMAQTGLRFFTVYGPWGRPDMAYWLFTAALFENRPIKVFNQGHMRRDFTYIDDIVAGVLAALDHPPEAGTNRIYNIGNNNPEQLGDLIAILEQETGRTAIKEMLPMQPGDVVSTYADITRMQRDFGWAPTTSLASGLKTFVAWYRARYV